MNYPANLQSDANVDTDDRKLDYSYSYYWTKTGSNQSNQYYRGYFKRGAPEGWVQQKWGAEGPPTEGEWIETKWNQNGSDDWVSWSDSASSDRQEGWDAVGPPADGEWSKGYYNGDGPDGWASYSTSRDSASRDGPDDRKLA
mmetsp:Transcript_26450/g.26900  ORF Transcript_26450/g.26900 Transcript_26450/m.26900 type:complete len:142 (-) Transcript_26450:52-477(-)